MATMWIVVPWLVLALAGLWLWRRSGQEAVEYFGLGLVRMYARLWHRWSSNGLAPLPKKGAAILAANHTCSADPAFLTAGSLRPMGFLIAREFYEMPWVRPLLDYIHCVPVRRDGRDAAALRTALARLSAGHVLCIFPEGDLSNAGRRRPRRGKPGVALLALRSRAPVYVAWIAGGPQTSDVLSAWLRPSRARVTYGHALDLSAYYDRPLRRRLLQEVTDLIMDEIHRLEANQKL